MIPMLAVDYVSEDVTGWAMSEKYDGVRAVWDGSAFRSRNELPIAAPGWFCDAMPKTCLDGELWSGRGTFGSLRVTVQRRNPIDTEWRGVRFVAFDAPLASGGFEDRIAAVRAAVDGCGLAEVAQMTTCGGVSHLYDFAWDIINAGGEGVMLRAPRSPYVCGRSRLLLRVKPRR